ncbi:hypothetical protein [Methylobacterium brachiatum]|uniref:hypothetical protein n=1 Tax=Methylobacterium brachiatum TaxID=269660 RepID=UPI000EFB0B79|nr:hypothetical protein [Methylobacterium brachiatum]AYO82691.1 hypothetical protein EBB05_10740 [Methylobacterium brachiatum]
MDWLGDVSGDRITVECPTCKRYGSYRIAGLIERFGPKITGPELLSALTASCRYRGTVGASADHAGSACIASLNAPKPASLEPPVPPGSPFTIEVWDERGRVEMRLAVIYPLDGAVGAYAAVEGAYLHSEITLRQGIRVVRKRERIRSATNA